jgi:hypothetical protein
MIKAITLDLDHTIINYSKSLSKLVENYFGPDFAPEPLDKSSLKLIIEQKYGNAMWTRIQSDLYSNYIKYAIPYDGVIDFLEFLKHNRIKYFIVSHKTQFSFSSPKLNLHESAMNWIYGNLLSIKNEKYFSEKNIFFEESIAKKIFRIKAINPIFHIDDLPEIISLLPSNVTGILFSAKKIKNSDLEVEDWNDILTRVSNHAK